MRHRRPRSHAYNDLPDSAAGCPPLVDRRCLYCGCPGKVPVDTIPRLRGPDRLVYCCRRCTSRHPRRAPR